MLLEGMNVEDAINVAERLRLRFAGLQLDADGKPVKFTASFGVSQWTPGDTIDVILKRADMALYQAKQGGRNRVMPAGAIAPLAPACQKAPCAPGRGRASSPFTISRFRHCAGRAKRLYTAASSFGRRLGLARRDCRAQLTTSTQNIGIAGAARRAAL